MSNDIPWQTGRGDLAKIALSEQGGATAEVYAYGAHLTSWKTSRGREWMFLSVKAQFEQGKAIRGGVPVVFPQFSGFGSGQRHGFARTTPWQLVGGPGADCRFSLSSDPATTALWPHQFRAQFIPQLSGDQLTMQLVVENIDSKSFQFTAALHTYFAVSDVHRVHLEGLRGLSYWDNNGGDFHKARAIYAADSLEFPTAIDRVFFDCTRPLRLVDGADTLQIQAQGFTEVVVWNPGEEAASKLPDIEAREYRKMLCVEAAVIDHPVHLAPGESWSGAQVLQA